MSFAGVHGNLLSWLAQVLVIGSLGAVLPFIFRIRHPRSRLAYCHAVLAACVLLPLIQPWQHSLVFVSSSVLRSSSPPPAGIDWGGLVVWAIAAGVAAKLCWLVTGLYQLRRFRRAALAIRPVPQAVRDARFLTRADALFCISRDVSGPATLGYVDPVILLPESFLWLDESAQRGIACHELLHVQRKDWLLTVVEEVVGALFWFHPAVWALLAQARLSREQLVDAEVVHLTAAPGPYINALLSIAAAPKRLRISPAAPFFTRRQLSQRMTSLLNDKGMSRFSLMFSYSLMAGILAIAGSAVFSWFPLAGETAFVAIASAIPRPPLDLPANRDPAAAETLPREFTIKVTPQAGEVREMHWLIGALPPADASGANVVFYRNLGPDWAPGVRFAPPPPDTFWAGAAAIRSIHPGEIVPVQELERMLASMQAGQLVEITQDADGRMQKIVIARRHLGSTGNEISFGPFNTTIGPGDADPATADVTPNVVD